MSINCAACWDSAACDLHSDADVWCSGCAGTGQFITGMVNNKPVGPGGMHFRCGGKGYHDPADRRRNAYYDQHRVVGV